MNPFNYALIHPRDTSVSPEEAFHHYVNERLRVDIGGVFEHPDYSDPMYSLHIRIGGRPMCDAQRRVYTYTQDDITCIIKCVDTLPQDDADRIPNQYVFYVRPYTQAERAYEVHLCTTHVSVDVDDPLPYRPYECLGMYVPGPRQHNKWVLLKALRLERCGGGV